MTTNPEFLYPSNSIAFAQRAINEQLGMSSARPINNQIGAVVLKVSAACNMRCTYDCYEYPEGDDSWKSMPRQMPDEVVEQTAGRLYEYVALHKPEEFQIVYHGGEPLEVEPGFYDKTTPILRDAIVSGSPDTRLSFQIHTNGLMLSKRRIAELDRNGIFVSVSLDGSKRTHDIHRRTRGRSPTYKLVKAGIERLNATASHRFSGLLAVITLDDDAPDAPIAFYEELLSYGPPEIDLLLPFGSWDKPPPHIELGSGKTPYANWLIPIYDRWKVDLRNGATNTQIRLFNSIESLIMGGNSYTEAIGPLNGNEIFVRSDGTIEGVDALNLMDKKLKATGFTINSENALENVAAAMRQQQLLGRKALSMACVQCPYDLTDVCGSGHPATRYSKQNGQDNRSVYCEDYAELCLYIKYKLQNRMIETVAELNAKQYGWPDYDTLRDIATRKPPVVTDRAFF